ncbi:BTB/POZ domain-containing protein [Euphorbia peplus]|nr:BTB/POZ domain-containing protein [Euphorbia peplus]
MTSKVMMISRLVQWKIRYLGPYTAMKSDTFKVGIWNWNLYVEKNPNLMVRLVPEESLTCTKQRPLARLVLRLANVRAIRIPVSTPTTYCNPDSTHIEEKLFGNCDQVVWEFINIIPTSFIIDVEFLDLKIYHLNGGETSSIWPSDRTMLSVSTPSSFSCFSRMLEESIYADVTIHTPNGILSAHKAILSASSPVFESMFHHDLKEKESSTIYIEDMSVDSCKALLSYLYGTIKHETFWNHRIALLGAANKYNITDLKDACEESLLEDINYGNVLERLQEAWLYQVQKLKKGCLRYLFEFGKIHDVRKEIDKFVMQADRELIVEMFQQVSAPWITV